MSPALRRILFAPRTSAAAAAPATREVYAFLDLAGTAGNVITPTILNNSMKGANPGTWSYGAGQHSGVPISPLTSVNHTVIRASARTFNVPIKCNGVVYPSTAKALQWDQDLAVDPTDWETMQWAPGETVDGNLVIEFFLRLNRSLGADTGGTSIDMNSAYYGGVFAVAQQQTLANGTITIRSHNGGMRIIAANAADYRIINFADKANQTNIIVILNAATDEYIAAGESFFLADVSDNLTFSIFGDYLVNGNGQHTVSGIIFNPNAWAVFPTFTVPAATNLAAVQTGVGVVTVSGKASVPRFKIERSSDGGANWSTLTSNYVHNFAVSASDPDFTYADSTVVDGTSYLYRVSTVCGTNIGASGNTGSVTVNNAAFATSYFLTSYIVGGNITPVSDYGMWFTVGAAPFTISELGFLGNAGQYAATMTVALKSAAGATLATAVANTSASEVMCYGACTPYLCAAGTKYRVEILSLGYNQIKGNTTTAVTKNVATIGGPSVDGADESSDGKTYGPVDFKYTL